MSRRKDWSNEAVERAALASDPNVLGVHDIRITGRLGSLYVSFHASIWQNAKPPEDKVILRNVANAMRNLFGPKTEVAVQLERHYFCPTQKRP